jgi:hypothetical protein
MTGHEFERKIRRLGRNCGIAVAFDRGPGKGSHGGLYYGEPVHDAEGPQEGNRSKPSRRDAASARADEKRPAGLTVAVGYRYILEPQENGWWLVRFPEIPEALTEGESKEEARVSAIDCVIAALEGYM